MPAKRLLCIVLFAILVETSFGAGDDKVGQDKQNDWLTKYDRMFGGSTPYVKGPRVNAKQLLDELKTGMDDPELKNTITEVQRDLITFWSEAAALDVSKCSSQYDGMLYKHYKSHLKKNKLSDVTNNGLRDYLKQIRTALVKYCYEKMAPSILESANKVLQQVPSQLDDMVGGPFPSLFDNAANVIAPDCKNPSWKICKGQFVESKCAKLVHERILDPCERYVLEAYKEKRDAVKLLAFYFYKDPKHRPIRRWFKQIDLCKKMVQDKNHTVAEVLDRLVDVYDMRDLNDAGYMF